MSDESGVSIPDPGLPAGGRIVDLEIERELQDSYLTYAMSTIMDRALPDVRDGLKPSQRRILVAFNDLNLRPGRKPMKCAKICGDTSGNYHPHGEGVIYPTLVGMAQRWKMRVPLVDPQGNFGSIEGDPPAAMRYTEARLTSAAMGLLEDLDLDTVEKVPNYDDRLTEPTVLPGKFPNLLVNGGMGIAVGMATSLPPHNPVEVLDSIIRVVRSPEISLKDLMEDEVDAGGVARRGLKGPDFPTGGVVLGRTGILQAYTEGRGRITVRGVCHVEDAPGGRRQIVIDEIPYGLMQNTLVEKIVEAVKEERLKDVSDVRNESGRAAQTRVVIELKKGADEGVVENQLYQNTPLQQTFSIINIALVKRQPRTLGVRELIDLYVEHRVEVIRRRTAHLLREAKKRAHTLEGLIYAVCDLDEVIRLIRTSSSREQAIERLMERRFRIARDHVHARTLPERLLGPAADSGGVDLTRKQAEAIGQLQLIRLVAMEIEKLVGEYVEVSAEIDRLEGILADEAIVLGMIVADCEEMRGRYDLPRLTAIEDAAGDIEIEALIPERPVAVTISHSGYIKRVDLEMYRSQGRGGKGIRASESKGDDFVERVFVASTHDDLLCFTDSGRVFRLKVYEIPEMSRTSRGRAIVNILGLREGERTCAFLAIENFEAGSNKLLFVSRGGIVKRTPLKAYSNVNRGGIVAVGLKEGDSLLNVMLTTGTDDVALVTASGMAIRFNEDEDNGGLRDMGRPAAGVKGIDLSEGDEVIGAVRIPMVGDAEGDLVSEDPSLCLLTITANGYGKRTSIDEYRVQPESGKPRSQSRGGKGRADIRVTERNGPSVAALLVHDSHDVVVVSRGGQLVRTPSRAISCYGRGTQGVRVVSLNEGDSVVAAAAVADDADGDSTSAEGPPSPTEA
ncbi:MAG: DNA gyrase subunit A [Phycisphaeraceae bacterium]|nr:DNA gyrase subunit A [Phycisphaeraceae bacterium]